MDKEVVIVGAGIGGLTAAWRLRDRDIVLLEAENRVGGRIKSWQHGEYWVSVGAHMFPSPETVLGRLVTEMGLRTSPIRASLLNIAYRDRIVSGGRPELLPLRLPLSLAGRMSFLRPGLKLRAAGRRYSEACKMRPGETDADVRQRLLNFMNDQSFAKFIGRLHPEVESIFRAAGRRLTGELEEVAAGCLVGIFVSGWEIGEVNLDGCLDGGPSQLPEAIARRLGNRVQLGAKVKEITHEDRHGVRVRYETSEGREADISARCAIVTTPAPVARGIVADIPADTAQALDRIAYGPHVVGGVVTNEHGPMPWDEMYSLLVVGRSFNMLFNHSAAHRVNGSPRAPGGTLMVYAGGDLARQLMNLADSDIAAQFQADIIDVFPEARGVIESITIQHWPYSIPFAVPGRGKLQATLEHGVGDVIFFAGDYVGHWTTMNSAAITAGEAALAARHVLQRT